MTNKVKHAVVMAGGTGGHIFPGLAVAEQLIAQGWTVSWLGTADRMEAQLVPKQGIEIDFIEIKGVRNKGFIRKLLTPFMVLQAICQALRILSKRKADVVLGFGGYAAMPGGIAAKILAKPLLIHEQNAAAGLTNRLLSKVANTTLVAFGKTKGLKRGCPVVGNPVRSSIKLTEKQQAEHQLRFLVVGGSLGAQVLNQQVPLAVKQLESQGLMVSVVHQTGKGNLAAVQQAYADVQSQVEVVEFIDDMAAAYQAADLVICRAGALTVSELALAGMPSILVPLPHAVDDHQTKNAQILVDAEAGILLPQPALLEGKLAGHLTELIELPNLLPTMASNCQKVAVTDSSIRVSQYVKDLVS
ncbi:undecaprenyldiphospho-muramoylpentapeptide beta-N-acetylglucosaminyltransferase [Saccharobesus litoralis]|uniref:UDP-N-acetylglucosamine--N-acetylmuramyl-(pentapeptide) pyrophosphoryl-undecaprenol N-acetylglucosamine transferase n=1 Tax=Saccharobesus litoralis TaxID=2172099 RepID=A0A2S0VX98_9ALTE|nr:undecaprenyldiphospho-muramoylpentapeptide beta-N-acetylglucosaminyltransferase [Saccharobesus litoralis]AWB68740.1 undecaprenyldiphospho-muramoylpentapeptide beta-N-acetylglucosaminyltransferase [Saccharobesus litoralis]